MLLHGKHLDTKQTLTKGDFDHIPDLHVIGRLGLFPIDHNPAAVANLVCNRAAFDQAGHFQIFIKTQSNHLRKKRVDTALPP